MVIKTMGVFKERVRPLSKVRNERIQDIFISSTDLSIVTFQDCEFTNIVIDNCSLQLVTFIDCVFRQSKIGNNEISETQFINCVFSETEILSNEFIKSKIMNSKFNFTHQEGNTYVETVLVGNIGLEHSQSSACLHEWVDIPGFTKIYVDCKKCGISQS